MKCPARIGLRAVSVLTIAVISGSQPGIVRGQGSHGGSTRQPAGPTDRQSSIYQQMRVDQQSPTDQQPSFYQETTGDLNERLRSMSRVNASEQMAAATDYRIGSDDLLEIIVLEAPELSRTPRVSAGGEISLSLVGTVHAEGLTSRELELVLQELLRRSYIKEPHVSVQIHEMQSHPVSVFGAVKKPGVFQIRQSKSLVELLSMAEGLDVDAGDTVIVERAEAPGAGVPGPAAAGAGTPAASNTVTIDLKKLLDTGDPALNVMVHSGDVVKVPRAGLVYVVGEVKKPGGFELKNNENISVLQAVALAQGLTLTSSSSFAKIIRTNQNSGQRREIPINLNKILAGKKADPMLEPRDIVFVPNSAARSAMYRGMEAAISIGTGVAVYRR